MSSDVSSGDASSRVGMLQLMVQPRIALGAVKVSLVVGSVLNLINNGEHLWTFQTVNVWQVAMNFFVPFCVSSYSAARNESMRKVGD